MVSAANAGRSSSARRRWSEELARRVERRREVGGAWAQPCVAVVEGAERRDERRREVGDDGSQREEDKDKNRVAREERTGALCVVHRDAWRPGDADDFCKKSSGCF